MTTVVHLCFGYAAVVPGQKPAGYSFLTDLAESTADQISIECAQPALHLGMLKDLSNKTILLGVIDLGSPHIESAQVIAAWPEACERRAPDRSTRLRHEIFTA